MIDPVLYSTEVVQYCLCAGIPVGGRALATASEFRRPRAVKYWDFLHSTIETTNCVPQCPAAVPAKARLLNTMVTQDCGGLKRPHARRIDNRFRRRSPRCSPWQERAVYHREVEGALSNVSSVDPHSCVAGHEYIPLGARPGSHEGPPPAVRVSQEGRLEDCVVVRVEERRALVVVQHRRVVHCVRDEVVRDLAVTREIKVRAVGAGWLRGHDVNRATVTNDEVDIGDAIPVDAVASEGRANDALAPAHPTKRYACPRRVEERVVFDRRVGDEAPKDAAAVPELHGHAKRVVVGDEDAGVQARRVRFVDVVHLAEPEGAATGVEDEVARHGDVL